MPISLHSGDILEKHLSTSVDVLLYSFTILSICSRIPVLRQKC